jgi:hypothetical protein
MGESNPNPSRRSALAAMTAATAALGAIALAGCGGSGTTYANNPRPPAPIVVTASISNEGVAASPERFGAGPIEVVVTNQTGAAQSLTLESVDGPGEGPGVRQATSPINPRDTARLAANLRPGRYRLHVDGTGIRAARLVVGPTRHSAQSDLLQP